MNRCAPSVLAFVLACAATLAAPAQAAPSLPRNFPQNALRGKIAFQDPPAIQLNGTATTMSPGYRVHGMDNMLVMANQLVNAAYTVDYTLDMNGQVFEVWILSSAEAARQPWPTNTAQAQSWTFDPLAQTWTKP